MVKNKILIVTGMHRSGTSAVSEWLHACGLPMGDELLQGDAGHENGYFEDLDFLTAHMAILEGRRLSGNGFITDPLKPLSYSEKDRLKDIIAYKNGFNYQWGWKDPRTCLFLDAYRDLVPGAFYLIVIRDYQSVVHSLINHAYRQQERKFALRTGITKFVWDRMLRKRAIESLCRKYCQHYLKIWIAYNQSILRHIQHLPENNYVVADCFSLPAYEKTIFHHLTTEWGFSLRFRGCKKLHKEMPGGNFFNVDSYIKNTALIRQAKDIEASLMQLSQLAVHEKALKAV